MSTHKPGEPRQWWIYDGEYPGMAFDNGDSKTKRINVIEHCAFAQSQEEKECFKGLYNQTLEQLEAMRKERDELKVASARLFSDAGKLTEERDAAIAERIGWIQLIGAQEDQIEKLEAELKLAVEALEKI